jgi:hypothetical protein
MTFNFFWHDIKDLNVEYDKASHNSENFYKAISKSSQCSDDIQMTHFLSLAFSFYLWPSTVTLNLTELLIWQLNTINYLLLAIASTKSFKIYQKNDNKNGPDTKNITFSLPLTLDFSTLILCQTMHFCKVTLKSIKKWQIQADGTIFYIKTYSHNE